MCHPWVKQRCQVSVLYLCCLPQVNVNTMNQTLHLCHKCHFSHYPLNDLDRLGHHTHLMPARGLYINISLFRIYISDVGEAS